MIEQIFKIFLRKRTEERASAEDYKAVVSSEPGQRVVLDLMVRYGVGSPSACYDRFGRLDEKATLRRDMAKEIIADLATRGNFRMEDSEKAKGADSKGGIQRLPKTAKTL